MHCVLVVCVCVFVCVGGVPLFGTTLGIARYLPPPTQARETLSSSCDCCFCAVQTVKRLFSVSHFFVFLFPLLVTFSSTDITLSFLH